MKTFLASVFAGVAAILAFPGGALQAQSTVFYNTTTTTANTQIGAEHFLQLITVSGAPGSSYTLSSFQLGLNYADGGQDTFVQLVFYTGVDTSDTSTNVLANATVISAVSSAIPAPGASGNYTYTFTPSTPLNFGQVTTVAVEVILENSDGSAYADNILNGRFTANAPSVGTSTGYVWADTDESGVFTGAQKTTFGLTSTNVRLALIGTVRPAPVIKTYARSGTTATLTLDSYSGVSYQLQRATSLTAGNWANLGRAVAGATGSVLTFTDSDGTDPAAFYRVVASQ